MARILGAVVVALLSAVSTTLAGTCDTILSMDFNEYGGSYQTVDRTLLRKELGSDNLYGRDIDNGRLKVGEGNLEVKHPQGVYVRHSVAIHNTSCLGIMHS